MTTQIVKWGNSQGIRLPKKILEDADMKMYDEIQLRTEPGKIILERPFVHKTFEERLAEYNGELEICDFDWGEPVGRELL